MQLTVISDVFMGLLIITFVIFAIFATLFVFLALWAGIEKYLKTTDVEGFSIAIGISAIIIGIIVVFYPELSVSWAAFVEWFMMNPFRNTGATISLFGIVTTTIPVIHLVLRDNKRRRVQRGRSQG